ncbi:hypothetical protein FSP39_001187 [Pinctada imbricata]|uniref:Uncharacterized protein n=1 Tax=Pinctada imbricata TaxID=66713 RepID=A0AA88XUJ8_PINIB|nr:hypothetical protein FSP39_001187 [Pinctada imbricata]
MGTWIPDPDSVEIALFLEDDVSVSPLFYRWLKNVHKKYDKRTDIAGYSLRGTCPRFRGVNETDLRAPETEFCMLYRATGSWGISPHRENWFKYIEWYKDVSRDRTFQPLVPGIIPNEWYNISIKIGTTENMWTMWHIHYTHYNNQFTLFLNFPDKMGLTSHWQEAGLHYQKHHTLNHSAPLLTTWDPRYDHLPDKLVKLDYDGKIIK